MAILVTLFAALAAVANAAEGPFNPEYYADPWFGDCASGKMQSPINLPADFTALPAVPDNLVTEFNFPVCAGAVVKNVASAFQVTWDPTQFANMSVDSFPTVQGGGDSISAAMLDTTIEPSLKLKMWPLQIHWHTPSEHAWDGTLTMAESHVVTAVAPGYATAWGCDAVWEGGDPVLDKCIAVFGTKYRLAKEGEEEPAFLQQLISELPLFAGAERKYPVATGFDLSSIIPADTSYYGYVGSLTTPPCTEGLRWHVFNQHLPISRESMIALEAGLANTTNHLTGERQLYRHNNRPILPLNERTLYFHDAGDAGYQGFCGDLSQVE